MLSHFRKDYRGGLRFALWAAIIIYSLVLVWSVGKAVYEDHTYFLGLSKRQSLKIDSDAAVLQQAKDKCAENIALLRERIAGLEGHSSTLETQNRDQQTSINNCQNQAVSMLAKATPKLTEEIRVVPILFEARDALTHKPVTALTASGHAHVEYTSIVLITTNQNEPRFHGILDCSSRFELATIPELSATGVTDSHSSFSRIQPEKKSWHSYELRVPLLDKEWSPIIQPGCL